MGSNIDHRYVLARSTTEIVVGLNQDTATAMIASQRAKTLWPVVAVCFALVVIVGLIVICRVSAEVAWPLAFMVVPVSTATIWKVLGKKLP